MIETGVILKNKYLVKHIPKTKAMAWEKARAMKDLKQELKKDEEK